MLTTKTLRIALVSTLLSSRVAFFDWKKDGDKLAVDDAGNPIWIDSANKELSVAGDTITRLNGEAASHRKRAETAEAKLKLFDDAGVTDPAAAANAIETVGKFKQGELITAGKVDEVRAEVTKSFEKKISDSDKAREEATSRADRILLGSAFAGSGFIKDKTVLPYDMLQSQFGNRFKIEGDKVVGMKADGSGPIYSEKNAGEVASFDEAIELIVNGYSGKNAILKGANNSGSGSDGKGGNGPGGKKSMTRPEFDKLSPAEKASFAKEMGSGKAEITD